MLDDTNVPLTAPKSGRSVRPARPYICEIGRSHEAISVGISDLVGSDLCKRIRYQHHYLSIPKRWEWRQFWIQSRRRPRPWRRHSVQILYTLWCVLVGLDLRVSNLGFLGGWVYPDWQHHL